jgi:histidine triad (HIT) family protein
MASVFTRIIQGELPARMVWQDERCVAFLSNRPLQPGHTLVVPRQEVDHWLDLEPEMASHLMVVAQALGKALQRRFRPAKVGLMIAGLEVPHVHLHVVPMNSVHDLDFANQDPNPAPEAMDRAAETIRTSLRALGYKQVAT